MSNSQFRLIIAIKLICSFNPVRLQIQFTNYKLISNYAGQRETNNW